MPLIVQKFGGTSLADSASRELLASIVARSIASGERPVLVVSAMGRRGDPYATDTLLDLLKEYPEGTDGLTADLMASCGEVVSACLIAALLNSRGIRALPMTASSACIGAFGPFGDAAPERLDPARLESTLKSGFVPVVAGFQGLDSEGRILTFGRGGSDTTAVAIGAALGADFVDIYKDVPGVAKADPRLIPSVPFMPFLDYDSMFRLARHGARVLHDKSAALARDAGVRLRVRSTFKEGTGTLIGSLEDGRLPPDFIGLSSSPRSEGGSKLTAVFARGRGQELRKTALDFADGSDLGVKLFDSDDPDVAAFVCPAVVAAEFARGLFALLEG
ncbi:MAG: hypothetical protein NT061_08710 [Spirochaetes bacterium]|nr:hypothetical protein [Spirochaetota bacterium]